ncbi:efflux RND transporter periplasmic adaptor subunit [Clostridium sp. SHJSY1]|uniref:efflux RND transporter periplasmic adaptor subunit n=1 Tax=Clostridium sp. SHJSY1 TaxID=2942483 RepID=UPI002874EC46|nr:efflux RND transporter periplasmic adaptor subunit [Clostridium sp. SHJSY1]MDS0525110.1 efflux RND transporter periplasmic adaptor subunit [Clostridium sp. SHJSY1]
MKNKFIKQLIICLIVLMIIIGSVVSYKCFFQNKPIVLENRYKITTAKRMNMEVKVQGKGSVYAGSSKDLIANNNGNIKNLKVKVGDIVNAGDTLFTVDNYEIRQNALRAENNLERQKLTLAASKNDAETSVNALAVTDAENQLNSVNEQLNKMTVTSPISGIVITKNNNNEDIVQLGKPILTIVDPASFKVKVLVDELNILKVKVGQLAEIKFNAVDDKKFEGVVEEVSQASTIVNNVTTYEVIVSIKNSQDIKIGMNANVNILVENKGNVLTIAKDALIEKEGKKYVMTSNKGEESSENTSESEVNKKSDSNLIPINTGVENGEYVEILDGILEGDNILISLPSDNSSIGLSSDDVLSRLKKFSEGH